MGVWLILDETLLHLVNGELVKLWWNATLPHYSEPWVYFCCAGLPAASEIVD